MCEHRDLLSIRYVFICLTTVGSSSTTISDHLLSAVNKPNMLFLKFAFSNWVFEPTFFSFSNWKVYWQSSYSYNFKTYYGLQSWHQWEFPQFIQWGLENTEYIRNEIHTNLTQKSDNVKQPSLSTCTVYCGYQLENIFFKSQIHGI